MNFLFQLVVVVAILASAFAGRNSAPAAAKAEKNFLEKGCELVHSMTKGHVS